MSVTDEKAYAKINLSIDVLGRMPDGYHEMKMVMQSVSLCDDVNVSLVHGSGKITVGTDKSYLPTGEDNIAGTAARVMLDYAGTDDVDVCVKIRKRIPVRAGLAGGSTDGAAVMRALNRLLNVNADAVTLRKLAEKVGSDVPYCITGGTALCEGRGEIITQLDDIPGTVTVICKPSFSVSTPMLFSKIDARKSKIRPDTEGILSSVSAGDVRGIGMRLYNVFEDVLPSGKDVVSLIKGILYDHGATGAVMTGTGSAVYGLFSDRAKAEDAVRELSESFKEVFLSHTVPKIEL